MSKQTSHSLADTEKIAAEWLATISNKYKDSSKALVVGLSGHLGAGKTAFVKKVAKELGIIEDVTSPSFVIMKSYATKHSRFKNLVHIDLYRLENSAELKALHLAELIEDVSNLVMIEWPENVEMEHELAEQLFFEMIDGVCEIAGI